MGVSLEVWRSRIGSYNSSGYPSSVSMVSSPPLLQILHFLILLVLLIIGNVEINPGPTNVDLKSCKSCTFQALTVNQHLMHQRIHGANPNFSYECPFELCILRFNNFPTLNAHVSHHGVARDAAVDAVSLPELHCDKCDLCFTSLKLLFRHVIVHLHDGIEMNCPISDKCEITRSFKTESQFRPHLSHYHPGWKDENVDIVPRPDRHENITMEQDNIQPLENMAYCDDDYWEDAESNDEGSEIIFPINDDVFEDEQIASHIAKFYAMLEGKLFIASSSVQTIHEHLAFFSEVFQLKLKSRLLKHLKDLNIEDNDILVVLNDILRTDVFYNTHHKGGPDPSFSSDYLRKEFYKKNFDYVEHVEDNLKRIDPSDRSAIVMYVPIKETLQVMLQDPSIQLEIDRSFRCTEDRDPNIIKDYTDGTVFKRRNVPNKRIDLFIFQDAFKCSNVLGSAKKKYKICGVYMTLGNIKPSRRCRLKAKRLVSLFDENMIESIEDGPMKAYRLLIKDLEDLEKNGILYKNETVPVRLQFLLGDNLGQHNLGGFMGGFTAEYFCRFCTMKNSVYKEGTAHKKPTFKIAKWRTKRHYEKALRKREAANEYSYKGIKYDSTFNKLQHFHVCDPGMPGCIAHDLFIDGVVDCDMASMIKYFVTKGYFSYDFINRRIRHFKVKGKDASNKPAFLTEGKKKLGGHAVQNWTLLRVLPILIGDKVPTDDKVWRLYLLLKNICQYACAPGLSLSQIDTMDVLINKYMKKRKCLSNNYKPKHHYFSHLAKCFKLFGAPIFLWTLGFEHFHKFFKKVARTSTCYINVPFTLVTKHLLYQAYLNSGPTFSSQPVLEKPVPLTTDSETEEYKVILETAGLSQGSYTCKKITIDDSNYKLKDWLLLGNVPDEEDSIYVGEIQLIVCDNQQKCYFLLNRQKATLQKEYGLFTILENVSELTLVKLEDLEYPCPAGAYEFRGRRCFTLKHYFIK